MSPRGEFLSTLFKILERQGVGYCVLRNYQDLYEDESSDVDLAVQLEDVPALEEALAQAANASGHRLVQRARFINFSHVYWHPEGGFLRLDFDTEFRWRIFPVLTSKSVITLRRREGDFYIPHPRHESVILFLAAIERGELSERYRLQLGKLYDQLSSPEELRRTFQSAFGTAGNDLALSQEQAASPVKEVQSELATGTGSPLWRKVRTSILRNSLRDRPSRRLLRQYLLADLRRLWERVMSPVGLSILYASAAPAQKGFDEFLEGTEVLFPQSKRVFVSGTGTHTGRQLRTLFKGGLFVRTLRVDKDSDLKTAVRKRSRLLFPSRELVWVETSNGLTFLAHAGSGFMSEFGPIASDQEASAASAKIIEFLSSALQTRARPISLSRQGAFVVLVGLDGSGKTTVAREICCQALRAGSIRKVKYFHWRPAIFGPASLPLPEFGNIPRKERLSSSPLQALLSASRIIKNLFLSSIAWWRVAHCIERGDLVLVDRYYYNYYLDPVSVKYYGPRWLLDCLGSYFPPPNIIAVLRAPPEVLLARKQELTAEELMRQNALLNKVPYNTSSVLELDASRPAAESATEILRRVGRGRAAVRGPWVKLFTAPETSAESYLRRMRLLRRGGQPFLLLPVSCALAAKSLVLYSPQTRRARAAKSLMQLALKLRLARRIEPVEVRVNRENPFAAYLAGVAVTGEVPEFGLLAGNPRVAGQRCILLLFDAAGEPKAVVKAATDEDGFRLIAGEVSFLKSVPGSTRGIPKLLSEFRAENVSAFTMEFVEGKAPQADDAAPVESLLTSWIDSSKRIPFRELGVWQRLEAARGGSLRDAIIKLASTTVHPTIYHGDFAPWNIRARGNDWTLVDWERGELAGPPLWDWLHFVVQPAILVERCSTELAKAKIDALLQSPAVKRYAERSGIRGNEGALTLAYLEYCFHVLRPTEGLAELQALIAAMGAGK